MKHSTLFIGLAAGLLASAPARGENLRAMGNEVIYRAQHPIASGPMAGAVASPLSPAQQAEAAALQDDAAEADRPAEGSAGPMVVGEDPLTDQPDSAVEALPPGEPLKVRAVAVIRGNGVSREIADLVRDAVEDALDAEGVIGSDALDRRLLIVRQHLINQGYYLSRIMRVGPDRGVTPEGILPLHLQVGTVQDIEIAFKGRQPGEDGKWFTNEQIARRFDGVKAGDGFNYGQLYLALYGLNAHPDLQADVNVGVTPGGGEEGDAVAGFRLDVEERFPLHGSLEINNYAVDSVDNWQAVGTLQYLNLTKADDVLTFSPAVALSGDQWSGSLSYFRPFRRFRGGHFNVYGGYTDTDVDKLDAGALRDLIYEGNGWFLGGQVSFNLIDTPRHNLSLFTGIQYRRIEQNLSWLGYGLSDYSVGYLPLSVGLSYTNRAPDILGGRNFATLSGTYNLLDTGDKIRNLWPDAETHYTLFRAQYARIQPLFGTPTLSQGYDAQWTAFFRLEGQWTTQTLHPNEQLVLGGHDNLRGYRVNGYAGDRGLYGTLELRTPVWRDLVASYFREEPGDPDSWIDALQFLAFIDYGWLDRERTFYGQDAAQFLWSVGFGARLALTKHTALNLDVAFPCRDVNENSEDDENVEVYLGIRAQF